MTVENLFSCPNVENCYIFLKTVEYNIYNTKKYNRSISKMTLTVFLSVIMTETGVLRVLVVIRCWRRLKKMCDVCHIHKR